ncbi:MAG: hypothetical protein ACREBJ_12025, partial [Nitrosotalea sp.]
MTGITFLIGIIIVLPNVFNNKNLSISVDKNFFSKKKFKITSKGKLKLVDKKQLIILYLLSALIIFTLFFTMTGAYFSTTV